MTFYKCIAYMVQLIILGYITAESLVICMRLRLP